MMRSPRERWHGERTEGAGMDLMKKRSLRNDETYKEGQTFKTELGLESRVPEILPSTEKCRSHLAIQRSLMT